MPTYWKIYSRRPYWFEKPDDFAEICHDEKVIAVGWSHVGDLNKYESREEIKEELTKDSNRINQRQLASCASSLWHFKSGVQEHDIVLLPSKNENNVYIGEIISEYYYDKKTMERECDFSHRRKVRWFRTLKHQDVLSIWPNGLFGGRQTVTKIYTNISKLRKLLRHSNSPRISSSGHIPFKPDKEWGREAEKRALIYLRNKGMKPIDVSTQCKGWDIECGKSLFEVKGRKSIDTTIRLTENEWKAAVKYGNKYTLLIFTASSKQELRNSFPQRKPDPARSENWKKNKRVIYEYFLKEL